MVSLVMIVQVAAWPNSTLLLSKHAVTLILLWMPAEQRQAGRCYHCTQCAKKEGKVLTQKGNYGSSASAGVLATVAARLAQTRPCSEHLITHHEPCCTSGRSWTKY